MKDLKINIDLTPYILIGIILCALKSTGLLPWSWFVCIMPFWVWLPIGVAFLVGVKLYIKRKEKKMWG